MNLLSIIVKLIAFVIAVVLMIGGVFRLSPHSVSKKIYINVLLIFLGSIVLLIGVLIP